MSLVTAALGIEHPPEEIAILCQMEKTTSSELPLGGIMEPMHVAASCGKLLQMICQAAVVDDTYLQNRMRNEMAWNSIPPNRYDAPYASLMPEEKLGQVFLEKYRSHNDPVTKFEKIELEGFSTTSHPVYENSQVKIFAGLLTGRPPGVAQFSCVNLRRLGQHY
ncbi:hypothetical protein R1sor_021435 [Riccia sorocarpa]|uniref:Uncharacterized protein n=1 Tax=Riccia sorocarpa TaxID=122646 RepID=A0ABD3GJ75_9MARC